MNREETRAVFIEWGNEPPTPVTIRGKTIYVREVSTAEMDRRLHVNGEEWRKDLSITTGATGVICDDQGNLVFDPVIDDVKIVGKVPWSRISKIVNAIQQEDEPQGN